MANVGMLHAPFEGHLMNGGVTLPNVGMVGKVKNTITDARKATSNGKTVARLHVLCTFCRSNSFAW